MSNNLYLKLKAAGGLEMLLTNATVPIGVDPLLPLALAAFPHVESGSDEPPAGGVTWMRNRVVHIESPYDVTPMGPAAQRWTGGSSRDLLHQAFGESGVRPT